MNQHFGKQSKIAKISKQGNNDLLGIDLRPKYKKAKSIPKGSMSMLFNVKTKNKRDFMNYNQDLDDEILKLKIAIRKEIPYEELDNDTVIKQRSKASANNIVRKKIVTELLKTNEELIKRLKLNSKILNNWLNYVVSDCSQNRDI